MPPASSHEVFNVPLTRRKDNERRTRARHTVSTYPAVAAQAASTSNSRTAPNEGSVLLLLPPGRRRVSSQPRQTSSLLTYRIPHHVTLQGTSQMRRGLSQVNRRSTRDFFITRTKMSNAGLTVRQVEPCPVQHRPGVKVAKTVRVEIVGSRRETCKCAA